MRKQNRGQKKIKRKVPQKEWKETKRSKILRSVNCMQGIFDTKPTNFSQHISLYCNTCEKRYMERAYFYIFLISRGLQNLERKGLVLLKSFCGVFHDSSGTSSYLCGKEARVANSNLGKHHKSSMRYNSLRGSHQRWRKRRIHGATFSVHSRSCLVPLRSRISSILSIFLAPAE